MKKENNLITFIKGFIIGMGIIFPISASGLAIVMGVYEKLLNIINNLKKSLKKEWKFILFTLLGIVVSALISCLLVDYTYDRYRFATILFFVGLIIGGIFDITKKCGKDYKLSNTIWTILGIIILVSVSFLGSGTEAVLSTDAAGLITIFFVGALAAGSMIIPGVSGSAILIIIGFYKPMLEVIKNICHFNDLGSNLLIAIFFGLGMILGIVVVSKLMNYFLTKYEKKTYFAVVGFIIASIIVLLTKELSGITVSVIELIVGIILFTIGFLISFKYLKEK